MATTLPANLASKRTFQPASGPITGLIVGLRRSKGELRAVRLETVQGVFEARLSKSLRQALFYELELQQPVRLWLKCKGSKVRVVLAVPLQAKPLVCLPQGQSPTQGQQPACIWVCTSKSCCRRGGDQLLRSLQSAASKSLAAPNLQIKSCGCLGTCKKGPALKVKGDRKVHQVSANSAPEWLANLLN